jgi:copper homeostasis protein
VVIGVLDAGGNFDRDAMRSLIVKARPLSVTVHRAFDVAANAHGAIDTLAELGIDILLTSGGRPTALEGRDSIREFVKRSGGRFRVMAGSGLSPTNVAALIEHTGVEDVHVGSAVTRTQRFSATAIFCEEYSAVDADLVRVFRNAILAASP